MKCVATSALRAFSSLSPSSSFRSFGSSTRHLHVNKAILFSNHFSCYKFSLSITTFFLIHYFHTNRVVVLELSLLSNKPLWKIKLWRVVMDQTNEPPCPSPSLSLPSLPPSLYIYIYMSSLSHLKLSVEIKLTMAMNRDDTYAIHTFSSLSPSLPFRSFGSSTRHLHVSKAILFSNQFSRYKFSLSSIAFFLIHCFHTKRVVVLELSLLSNNPLWKIKLWRAVMD